MEDFWSFAMSKTADGGTLRNLYILTEVSSAESWWIDTMTPARFIRELNYDIGDLTVWIDSPGGDAFAGSAIYEALRAYSTQGKGRVIVKVIGCAASAASLIAMAGDEILVGLSASIMIHNPWSQPAGNAEKLRAVADALDEIREGQVRAYMRRSGKSRDEVVSLMDAETYMNAKTAVKNGFADGVIGDDGDSDDWVRSHVIESVHSCVQRADAALSAAASTDSAAKNAAPKESANSDRDLRKFYEAYFKGE